MHYRSNNILYSKCLPAYLIGPLLFFMPKKKRQVKATKSIPISRLSNCIVSIKTYKIPHSYLFMEFYNPCLFSRLF
jgi:hypothetical protein